MRWPIEGVAMRQNLLLAVFAVLLLAAFLGYLAFKIAALPLTLIIGAVVAMCVFDFVRTAREER
jgi:uncharacterized membrane protein AbrB (regulator of aidB expression)